MKLTYGQMKDRMFKMGLSKLTNTPHKNPKVAYNLAKIARKIDEEQKVHDQVVTPIQTERDEKITLWSEKDETGKPKAHPGENGRPGFTIAPAHEEEWQAYSKTLVEKMTAVDAIEFEIDRPKIKYPDDLGEVKLTPNEIMSLDPLLEFVESAPQ